nr:MAG TPA: hypothetical protein [Bacteriophage sp.]
MEKQEKSVNKHLYKILIYVLKYIPFILALMEQQSKIISVLSNIANPDYRMSKV